MTFVIQFDSIFNMAFKFALVATAAASRIAREGDSPADIQRKIRDCRVSSELIFYINKS